MVSRGGRGKSSNCSGQPFRHERAPPTPPPVRPVLPSRVDELPPLGADFWSIVDDGVAALDLALAPAVRAGIDAHVRLLLAWNAAINLTGLREPAQIARGHVLDSLTAAASVDAVLRRSPDERGGGLLDLGSGGGFPGLPLALVVGAGRCALVDSVAKKAAFLKVASLAARTAAHAAEAGAWLPSFEVLAERAEDLADEPTQRAGWDVVTARAVGSLAEVAELGLPLLTVGGRLVVWKLDSGDQLRAELDAARAIVRAAGGSRPHVASVRPAARLGLTGHVLVTIRKARPTPDRYPRQPAERRRSALLR
jgi:16S rRNA (guanine527-N7)-methyltransferase